VWGLIEKVLGGAATPKFVFVLGGPGCGKGTNCARLKADFGFEHLSAGDLLREEKSRQGSEVGALISEYIKEGKIVPAEITIGLLKAAMQKNPEKTFLIDGFPRKLDQCETFMAEVGKPMFTLFFEVSEAAMTAR
jgi:UMP-CMP kinase